MLNPHLVATNLLIDHKTDNAIQLSLRNELGHDTTVITIAHRLQTIMDGDKIVSRTWCPSKLSF
jgi:ABC-type transport system involved in Fe-S cluster assembly fused permease/ATPase subunit